MKSLKDEMIEQMEYLTSPEVAGTTYNYKIYTRDWENYGKSRTYLKIYETRDNSKHNKAYDCGYIDNQKNVYVPGKQNITKYTLSGERL